MEGDGDVRPGEVPSAPGAAALPPARVGVGGVERAEQRDGEVLGQRVADEADAALLRSREPVRVADALATRAGLGSMFADLR